MNQEKANEITRKLVGKHKVVAVTSDGQIYLDCNPETLERHCEDQKLKLFPVKGFPEPVKKHKKKDTE